MNSVLGNNIWNGENCYITARSDFLPHNFDPTAVDMGTVCLIAFSSSLFKQILATVPHIVESFEWPYSTTPLKLCTTKSGKRFAAHFPSYGGTRIANSLEQLSVCGIRSVFGLGLGGTPQEDVEIGDIILLEGSIRGDGVSRYYAPVEFPAIADFDLMSRLRARLEEHNEKYHMGLSFGTDALYREEESLIDMLKKLKVLSIDLESSAFLAVGRRLGLKCCWVGVVSDRLVKRQHEGNIHSEHIVDRLLRLGKYIMQTIDEEIAA
jgi:purine-nucleoside phosphorylase